MKYRGVSYTRWGYQALLRTKGRMIYLGLHDTPELAAKAYDVAAEKHHGIKAKLNFSGRLITVRQEQIYRLCSPDFYNLPYWAAGILLGISTFSVWYELQKVKEKCPSLFPLYRVSSAVGKWHHGINDAAVSYETWMDSKVVYKF